jgi:hypothetical protein
VENLTGRSGACGIHQCLRPAVVQPNGVRWFDIETVWRLAVERQNAGKKAQRRAPRRTRPEGVERVTGAETRQITAWFAAGLSHAEIVLQSGKTHETIRDLYAQYVTPSGARLRMTSYLHFSAGAVSSESPFVALTLSTKQSLFPGKEPHQYSLSPSILCGFPRSRTAIPR